jgi:hypothetical protein
MKRPSEYGKKMKPQDLLVHVGTSNPKREAVHQ